MRDANFAANSQLLREMLYEVTTDANLTAQQHRDHAYVLREVKRRLNERYGVAVTLFNLIPRDGTYLSVEALNEFGVSARIIATHFANTAWMAKRKHFALWQPDLKSA
ncbi:hypothetical protein pEaSNUABM37_00006 [Erwinia phage pEa_SNUABM_37]|nr:hypothetical protein pEaSNUABM37_00006 [Erwinia phage pEa_SNUABM_37]QXO10476.1 hypothetical protein pEaSNUABM48_00006 [Erwinia phage pEa_SNUABM_48]